MLKLNQYIKIEDAAKLIGVTSNTLRNWEKEGKIKVYRNPINNYRLYKKEDLEDILNNIELV